MVAVPRRDQVFISYSHKDRQYFDQLQTMLKPLVRGKQIETWADTQIRAGAEWKEEIKNALARAKVAVLLVSPDFLGSDFIAEHELPPLLSAAKDEGMTVLWVATRPSLYKETEIERYQAANDPLKPLDSFRGSARGRELVKICQAIKDAAASSSLPNVSLPERASSVDALSPIWYVPHNRNRNFTGRDALLSDLREALVSGDVSAATQAIGGLGGVGKTQIAVEYTYRYATEYKIVWWVQAEEPATLAADYARMGGTLRLSEKDETDQRRVTEAVRAWLGRNADWLLVFDNARDPGDIRDYLPQGGTGHVLVTSRNQNWGGIAQKISVPILKRAESVNFLLKRTGQTDRITAAALAEALGDLPLALEQAAAYIEEISGALSDYLRLFQRHYHQLLQRGMPSEYPATVATTWGMSFEQIQKVSPAGADLMNLCAFLGPDDISLDTLREGGEYLSGALAAAVADPLGLSDAVAVLRRYSLVELREAAISIHRLVQAVVRDRLTQDAKQAWANSALLLVEHDFPSDCEKVQSWSRVEHLLPHALVVTQHAETFRVAVGALGQLLQQVGLYQKGRARLQEAKLMLEKSLAIEKEISGANHPKVASCLTNLGFVLKDMEDLKGAHECLKEALTIDETNDGRNPANIAVRVTNLGLILKDMNDLEGGRVHFERALALASETSGPDSLGTVVYHNNLGFLLKDMNDLEAARVHFQRALSITQTTCGPNDPDIAVCCNNLGIVLKDMGDLEGARRHVERALTTTEVAFGPDDPRVAIYVDSLGFVLKDMKDFGEAQALFLRALAIDEAVYGVDHPKAASRAMNLGLVLNDADDRAGARMQFERAFRIFREYFGEKHHCTLTALANLAPL
jgi:tetratricopeptide (TPR) repeat protein